jgi:nitrite reductase (NO-forming)
VRRSSLPLQGALKSSIGSFSFSYPGAGSQHGERVRFYVVNAGPTHPCNFHVVGEQFDTVYLGAPPGVPLSGIQTFGVAPGGGMVFEMLADIPGEFVFVNHGFGHGQKGAIGILNVQG